MKKILFIAAVALMVCSCRNTVNKDVTGIIVENNKYSPEELAEKFPNLVSVTFKNCVMDDIDMGKLNFEVKEVVVDEGCTGELVANSRNNGVRKFTLYQSSIDSISSFFLENMAGIYELHTFHANLRNISFPEDCEISILDLFYERIKNFSTLKNLPFLSELIIEEEDFYDEFDISSISELRNLEKLTLTSNFTFSSDITFPSVKELEITDVKNFSAKEKINVFPSVEEFYYDIYLGSDFPSYLSTMENLKSLTLFSTEITDFPEDLSDFKTLERFGFIMSSVEEFPDNIIFPKSLKYFCTASREFNIEDFRKKYPDIKFSLCEL